MKEDKYILIAATSLSELQIQVNGAIALGYYPIAGFAAVSDEIYDTTLFQPMMLVGEAYGD